MTAEHQGRPVHRLAENGALRAWLQAHDWSQTPLGAIETWPERLKTAVPILLTEMEQALLHGAQSVTAGPVDSFQVTLFNALRGLTDANEIQATAARLLGEALGASRVIYVEVLPGGEDVFVQKHYTNGVAALSGPYCLADFGRNLTDDHRAGRTAIVSDVANSRQYTASAKAMYRAINIAAHVDVPLIKHDQFVALLAVHQATPRAWTDLEVRQIEETAECTWAAVERARVEAALRVSEANYRTLFESIDEGFCIIEVLFDAAGTPFDQRILQANPAFERQSGLAHPEGKTASELVPGGEPFWHPLCAQVIATGESMRTEMRSDGLNRWFDVLVWRVGDAATHQVAVVFTDISDRKQAEAALRASENRLRLALKSAALGTWDFNPATGELQWDEQCKAMFGLSPAAAVNYAVFLSGLHPDDRDRTDRVVQQTLQPESGGEYDIEYRTIGIEDGVERWIAARGKAFFNPAGVAIRFIGTVLDMTEPKRAAAERERLLHREQAARAAAERANRVKDEFLAVLSHELRSPLNPILGWARVLQTDKLDAACQRLALQTIERNAKRQAQLIEDLLDIACIMQGKLTLTATAVDLLQVITAAIETVQLAAEAKQIAILLDLDAAIQPMAGDAARLQQVVWNLLTNAVKFTPPGGQVTIELRQIAQRAQLRVIDTGKGIQPEFLPYVFESFRQEDGSTTRQFGGLGLGLAIVRQIVELHGGTVAAESNGEHQGATFIVQLPTQVPERGSISEPVPPAAAGRRLKDVQILLVDDDPDTRAFETFLLEQNGAVVIATATGFAALQVLDQWLPDVIVSDIGMADMDGYTLMQQIRSRSPSQGGKIPAIALTAYATEVDRQRAMQTGFQLHLTKPLDPESLIMAIMSLCNPD